MTSAVASRYARAFADVVMSPGSQFEPSEAVAELRMMEEVLAQSSDLRHALSSPAVRVSQKRAVILRFAEELKLKLLTRNFLFVLIDHKRIGLLSQVREAFETEIDQRLGFARAEVLSAQPLDVAQTAEIEAGLAQLTGKQIRARFRSGPVAYRRRYRAHWFHCVRRFHPGPVGQPAASDRPAYGSRTLNEWLNTMAQIRADEIARVLRGEIENYEKAVNVSETGSVISVGDGIARIYGLEKVMAGELIEFPHNVSGIALNLEEDQVGAVLLGEYQEIKEGDEVRRTGQIMSVPVGEGLIGRVVNALGEPIDGKGPIASTRTLRHRSDRARRSRPPARERAACRPVSRPSTR